MAKLRSDENILQQIGTPPKHDNPHHASMHSHRQRAAASLGDEDWLDEVEQGVQIKTPIKGVTRLGQKRYRAPKPAADEF